MSTTATTVRVWVPDVWQVVELPAAPDVTIAELKAAALQRTIGNSPNPADYVMKYRGALVADGDTLAALNLPDNAPLVVLPARRRPVV